MRPPQHVLVVGGGIAGLALAAALDPRQVRVTLVEERPERAGAGTVLALWRRAMEALDGLGVGERVRGASTTQEHGSLRDAHGRLLLQRRIPELCFAPRPELVAALESALPDGVTRLTRAVTDPRLLAGEVGADLVVGADGVRSVCRQTAFVGAAPVLTDWIALRGHLPGPPPPGPTEWWGPGGLFGVTPGPQGAAWFCAVREGSRDPVPDRAQALALAHARFAGWDRRLPEVLARVGDAADVQRIMLAPALARVVDGPLVLIGDAAHAMSPNLGRGANEAILDACSLATAIHRHGSTAGPRSYQRRRHLSGQMLRLGASTAMRTATAGRIASARDRALRMVPRNEPPTH